MKKFLSFLVGLLLGAGLIYGIIYCIDNDPNLNPPPLSKEELKRREEIMNPSRDIVVIPEPAPQPVPETPKPEVFDVEKRASELKGLILIISGPNRDQGELRFNDRVLGHFRLPTFPKKFGNAEYSGTIEGKNINVKTLIGELALKVEIGEYVAKTASFLAGKNVHVLVSDK